MDLVFKYGGVLNIPDYNCSALPEKDRVGMKRPYLGTISIVYGIIATLLFLPCLKVCLTPNLIKLSCYKIMFFVGVVDVGAIFMCSILTGWLALHGAVFCNYPRMIYYFGEFGLCAWLCSCLANILLLINRILNFKSPNLADTIFEGRKTIYLLTLPVIYGLYSAIFTRTICFNSTYYAWFFDPFIFPDNRYDYSNDLHSFNNLAVVICTCFLYMYVGFMVIIQWGKSEVQSFSKKVGFL
ncbi:unnamed protein product [Caenorhabditis angaria]|uniref:Uncharacterized protein n=1 Tax=Caenorhabditis angaria TaxID=860376 RepID=A0A9P1N9R3_9PELO|nr:unnamed protein product [Caenorhabditis angaria]